MNKEGGGGGRIGNGTKEKGETGGPSKNLWIGNLSNDATDGELMEMFGKYGTVNTVTTYPARNYGFVFFNRLEDAQSAKNGLQGTYLRGSSLRIEFARPAKPGKQLWVGGISPSVTKEQLENEFSKFGKIEDFKFLRDKNSALIDYCRLEDAAEALKHMNGKHVGGEPLRVDFLRSHSSRRENWSDSHDARDGQFSNRRSIGPPEPLWMPADAMRNFHESSQFGHKRLPPSRNPGGRRDAQSSKVLWIGYPPSVQIDEQMLHNAMILFGEIERIKSFPSRNYSFVEFRSIDEARRAKEGLQGRLFNDPRIQIMFSCSELAPPKDAPGFFTGIKGPIPDMFFSEPPFGPGEMEFCGHNPPMVHNNFPGPLAPNGMTGLNMMMRPFGPQGGLNPLLPGPEVYNELVGLLQNFSEANSNSPMGQNWRRCSPPALGMLPSPVPGVRPPITVMPSTWDGSDAKPFARESKRLRIDGPPIADTAFTARMDGRGSGVDQPYGLQQPTGRGPSDLLQQGQRSHSPVGSSVATGVPLRKGLSEIDYCWRGTIAKGGVPVCLARCVPIGEGIASPLPEIVNCSARTGLDMLAKHYAEASGFDVVFFLPDSEDDFASYTEFLSYLREKSRAGVVKFNDGTTLFLVPPSDFLVNVLNISGPERLYGVVLKLPQQKTDAPVLIQQRIPPPRWHLAPSQSKHKDYVPQLEHKRGLHEDMIAHPSIPLLQSTEEFHPVPSVRQDSATQDGVSVPPELFATLTALLPSNVQPSASGSAQPPLTSFPAFTPDKAVLSLGQRLRTEADFTSTPYQTGEQLIDLPQQPEYRSNTGAPFMSQSPSFMHVMNGPDNHPQATFGSSQTQVPLQSMPQQGVASSRPSTNFTNPHQGGHFTVPQPPSQPSIIDASLYPEKNYGTVNVPDASGLLNLSVVQQLKTPASQPAQVQGMNLSQSQLQFGMSSLVDNNLNAGFSNQMQHTQSAPTGVGHSTEDGESDRNQRYQSTLQFAANLLLQIQQRQQQGSTQAAQDSTNH